MLEQHHRLAAPPLAQQIEQSVGDQLEPFGFVADRVAAGMEDDAEQSERLGAIDLVAHRVKRLPAQRAIGRREVDQVARMRDDRKDAGGLDRGAERANFLGRHDAPAPLVGVLREDLQRVAAVHDRPLDGARQSAGDRHVRSEPWHVYRNPRLSVSSRPDRSRRIVAVNGCTRRAG